MTFFIAAFSVETHSFGGDGMKIRDEFATPKLFVNFCSSILIEEPKDKFGKVMDINMETADGLQIPLIIGKVRKLSDGNAVDIVFSPNVISHSNHHRYFKQQIIELGLQWLEQETELKFEKKNVKENETCKYIGGLGENKDIPVLFYIDEEMIRPPDERIQKHDNKSQNKNNVQKEGFLSSTKSLLTQLEKEKDELLSSGTETRLPFQEVAKKPMIEEVGVASNDDIYKAAKNAVSVSMIPFVFSTSIHVETCSLKRIRQLRVQIKNIPYNKLRNHQLNWSIKSLWMYINALIVILDHH